MSLAVFLTGNPVIEVMMPAFNLDSANLRHLFEFRRQFVIIFHPCLEIVQFVFRHPVEKRRSIRIKRELLNESAVLHQRSTRLDKHSLRQRINDIFRVETVTSGFEKAIAEITFREIVDAVKHIDGGRARNHDGAAGTSDFERRK